MKYKKWIIIIILLIGLFSFYTFSHANQEGLSWSELSSTHPLKHEKLLMKNELLQHLFLFPQASFDEKASLQIIQSIHKLPPSLLSKLVDKDVKIKLFSGKLTDNASAAHLKGIKPRGYGNNATWDDVPGMGGSQMVFVKIGASDKGSGHGSVNLELHELAHSIDHLVYEDIQDDPEFLSIWGNEVDILFPNQPYFLNYPEEYFAEAFALFYVNQEQNYCLKRLAPHTYDYIKQLH
jgi:hypothetical protein